MRLLGLVSFIAVVAVACGDAAARPKPAATASAPNGPSAPAERNASVATQPAAIVPASRGSSVGALERPSAMRRFFESLAKLEDGRAQDDVRIVQFGDSHTAADIQSAAARRALQSRFGDGGRGFVAIGRPWKLYRAEGVRGGMSSDWSSDKAKLGPHPTTDGIYGLAGIGLVTRSSGARAWTDITVKTSKAEVAYFEQPNGGSFDVLVDGLRVVRISTRPSFGTGGSAFRTFDVAENAPHQLEVRAVGDGEVRVFGVALDRGQHGVVYDALGINGARINQPLAWNEQHWAEQLRHRAPSMIVLAYGTNESVDEAMPAQTYERQLVDLLGRIARAVPGASCLLLGPPDRAIDMKDGSGFVTAPKILEIIQSQRRVAEAAGCAFYDQMAAMGGEGAMAAWALEDPPRGQRDRVHLTKEGYSQLGSAFASDVMRAYAQWRKDSGLPSSPARAVEPPPLGSNGLPALPVAGDNTAD